MGKLSPTDLGRQLKRPAGEEGLIVAENMNTTNLAIQCRQPALQELPC